MSATDLYSGYFYKIINKAKREGAFDDDIEICILSAKHGLIDADREIEPYDQRMDAKRAQELATEVQNGLKERIRRGDYDRVVVNAGAEYRRALDGFDEDIDVETYWIDGDGIGAKGSVLKQFVRGDHTVLQRSE